jgi:hypothetical protein
MINWAKQHEEMISAFFGAFIVGFVLGYCGLILFL